MKRKAADRVFDQLDRGEIDVWNVIHLYEGVRDIRELEDALVQNPHLASNILYIMSEISSTRIVKVWRSVLPFLTSPDLNCVFYALDVIHSAVAEASQEEVLSALNKVHTSERSITNKIRTIRNDVMKRGESSANTLS